MNTSTTPVTPLASLSLACRLTLNLHSLNNEGGEGNQIQTRFVDIVDPTAQRHTVNAISGDMMRHVLGEKLLRVAQQRHLPLSGAAQRLDANRIAGDKDAMKEISAMATDAEALDLVLRRCAISEMMGTLITEGKRSLPRASVVEFGWVVGVPDHVHTDSFFHAKYQSDRGSEEARREAKQQQPQESTGANLGQAIFHRPASSGVYALVCHLELARIGYNDIKQQYALTNEEIRYSLSSPRRIFGRGEAWLHLRCSALVRPCSLKGAGRMAGLLCCTSSPARRGRARGSALSRECAAGCAEQSNSGQG